MDNTVMMEKSELMKLTDITPYANNPRKNDRAIEPVKNSIINHLRVMIKTRVDR